MGEETIHPNTNTIYTASMASCFESLIEKIKPELPTEKKNHLIENLASSAGFGGIVCSLLLPSSFQTLWRIPLGVSLFIESYQMAGIPSESSREPLVKKGVRASGSFLAGLGGVFLFRENNRFIGGASFTMGILIAIAGPIIFDVYLSN